MRWRPGAVLSKTDYKDIDDGRDDVYNDVNRFFVNTNDIILLGRIGVSPDIVHRNPIERAESK